MYDVFIIACQGGKRSRAKSFFRILVTRKLERIDAFNQGESAKPMLRELYFPLRSKVTSQIHYCGLLKMDIGYLASLDSRWKHGTSAQLITGTDSGSRQLKTTKKTKNKYIHF